jgi:hypothetical protein
MHTMKLALTLLSALLLAPLAALHAVDQVTPEISRKELALLLNWRGDITHDYSGTMTTTKHNPVTCEPDKIQPHVRRR